MKFLENVVVIFNPTVLTIIEAWEEACLRAFSSTYEPTLTSGMDGKHSLHSGHYFGRSIDFRSRDIPPELRISVKNTAQDLLGSDYLVLLESDHYHIQRNKNSF